VKYNMSVLTQLSVPGEARPLKIAPEAIYTSSLTKFSKLIGHWSSSLPLWSDDEHHQLIVPGAQIHVSHGVFSFHQHQRFGTLYRQLFALSHPP